MKVSTIVLITLLLASLAGNTFQYCTRQGVNVEVFPGLKNDRIEAPVSSDTTKIELVQTGTDTPVIPAPVIIRIADSAEINRLLQELDYARQTIGELASDVEYERQRSDVLEADRRLLGVASLKLEDKPLELPVLRYSKKEVYKDLTLTWRAETIGWLDEISFDYELDNNYIVNQVSQSQRRQLLVGSYVLADVDSLTGPRRISGLEAGLAVSFRTKKGLTISALADPFKGKYGGLIQVPVFK